MDLQVAPLDGPVVRLEPISETHKSELRAVAESGLNWTYMPIQATGDAFDNWFDWSRRIHEQGREHVYIVRGKSDGAVCGSTRFLNIEPAHKRCEIGHTWYSPAAQGTRVNPSAKYLLFDHAFSAGRKPGRTQMRCPQRPLPRRHRQAGRPRGRHLAQAYGVSERPCARYGLFLGARRRMARRPRGSAGADRQR